MSRGMLWVREAMLPYGSLYWGTLTAFCLPLRRRENFRVRLALSLLPLLLLPPLYSLGFRDLSPEEQWIAAPLVFAISILLLAGLVAFCVETDWSMPLSASRRSMTPDTLARNSSPERSLSTLLISS